MILGGIFPLNRLRPSTRPNVPAAFQDSDSERKTLATNTDTSRPAPCPGNLSRTPVVVLFILLLLAFGREALPQESPPKKTNGGARSKRNQSDATNRNRPPGTYEVQSGTIETWIKNGNRLVYLTGSPVLTRNNEQISAEVIVGWLSSSPGETGDADEPDRRSFSLKRIYAEGNVRYHQEDRYLQARRFSMNTRTRRGLALNVTLRTFDPERSVPVLLRADRVRIKGKGRYVLTGVHFTTCDFSSPHYSLTADTVRVHTNGATSVSATHITPRIRRVPFGYWPFLYMRSDADVGPLKEVVYGNNDRFGNFVKTLWGVEYSSLKRAPDGDVRTDKNGKKIYNYRLDLELEADWLNRRGWAVGPGGDYEFGKRHSGTVKTYYLKDTGGPNPDEEFDRQFLPQEREDRGRGRFFHRYDILGLKGDYEQLRLDTELDVVSDRDFREEFFEEDFKTDKEPESYTYLRYVNENSFTSFLTRYRVNDFQTQTESLPALTHERHGEPIGDTPFLYSTESSLANLRERLDVERTGPDFRTVRLDTYHQVAYPLSLGPIQTRTFTGARFSAYEQAEVDGDQETRQIYTAGVQAFDKLHRTFDVRSPFLGLNGLRHIISWDARYTNNVESTLDPDNVRRLDNRDSLGEFEEVYLELRNRFQTRRPIGNNTREEEPGKREERPAPEQAGRGGEKDLEAYTFLDLGAAIEFYPDVPRDRRSAAEQNFLDPFAWIPTQRAPATGRIQDDNWSLLNLDFELTPNLPLSISGNAEVRLETRALDTASLGLNVQPLDNVTASIDHSYVRGLTETTDLTVDVRLSDHWSFSGVTTYDFRRHEFQEQRFHLTYHLHDFNVLFTSIIDERRDDSTFAISITPNFTDFEVSAFRFEQDEFE